MKEQTSCSRQGADLADEFSEHLFSELLFLAGPVLIVSKLFLFSSEHDKETMHHFLINPHV